MTSLLTNNAAKVALQTLTLTMKNLDTTQNRISTGLRVANASDNAAYWAIATTMRADSSTLSTVSDALNLGASTIDVASNGLNKAVDVAKQIRDKLVAAAQPGIDRTKVQSEITQLQSQLKSIADSASFNGQNWLSVNSSVTGYNAVKSIVSSFSRDAAGAVSVGTIAVNTSGTALFDGVTEATYANAASGTEQILSQATVTTDNTAPIDAAPVVASGKLTIQASLKTVVDSGTVADERYTQIEFNIDETILGAGFDASTDVTEAAATASPSDAVAGVTNSYNASTKTLTINYDVSVDNEGTAELQRIVLTIANVELGGNGLLDDKSAATSGTSGSTSVNVNASISGIDISALTDSETDLATLNAYTKIADKAISDITKAASDLGSVKSRVNIQQSFISSLKDSIDKGIGALVDADMNEESTRLQALQVQQQLGVQALSIANQTSQTILSLFR